MSDLQGDATKLRDKVKEKEFDKQITLHQCRYNKTGVSEKVGFVLLFYMAHKIPDKEGWFREIGSILKPKGK